MKQSFTEALLFSYIYTSFPKIPVNYFSVCREMKATPPQLGWVLPFPYRPTVF